MSDKDSAQDVIDSYRKKRQQSMPFLVGGLAIVLVAVGIVVLIQWLRGPNPPAIALFTTPTFTPTVTATSTATATGLFVYKIEEGDTLDGIAKKFNVEVLVIMALNKLTYESIIRVGDEILIPPPDLSLDTPTPIPTGWRGTIEYIVAPGDSLELIAVRFNSTVDAILKENKALENANEIFVGQVLIIPVNIATPVPTRTPGLSTTLTPAATNPASLTVTP